MNHPRNGTWKRGPSFESKQSMVISGDPFVAARSFSLRSISDRCYGHRPLRLPHSSLTFSRIFLGKEGAITSSLIIHSIHSIMDA